MKKLLFLILVLFTVNITFSQINTNVSLKCQIYASSGTAPTFNVQSLVSDELSKYDGSSVAAGDKLFIIDGSECYELHISSITLGSGSVLNFVAYDSTGVLTTIPNGQAAVIRKYSIQQVPFIPAGLRSDLASCILQKIASTVNSVTGSGVDNCTKTITQTAHGFSDGDVLYWDETLSEYVTFVGNYANASWPVYVVLDSLTANTFTGVSCGVIDKDFSLPEGLYYATNTGLSLTPAAIEYPVLKVYDGKAQVLALPGLEFDATGKELFDVVTVTGQRTVDGGDVLDLHADSTRVNITIADTVATDVGHALELLRNNSGGGGISGLTTNVIPKATSGTTVGDGSITDDGTKVLMTKPIGLLNWATGSEPGSPSAGWLGYNSTLNLPSFRLGSTWESPAFGTWGNTQIMYGSATSGRFTSTSIFTYTSGILRVQNITINGAGTTYGDTGVGFSLPGITRRLEMNGNPATTDESMLSLRTGGMSGSTLNDRIALLVFPGTVASSATSVTRFTIAKDSAFVNKAMDLFVGRAYAPNFDGNTITKHVAQNWKSGQVGLGTTLPQDIEQSALFEMKSTTQGFLPSRMTGAQAEAIATPAEGLMVYATDGSGITITTKGWWGYDGATWVKLN